MNKPEAPTSASLVAGKYQLVSLIGRGGMGSVWEARHASLGTRFAIKFIEAEYADSQEARSRFDREARAAATIQSKHAIQIYDHGVTEDGRPYIVMELLQGEPLDKRIERLEKEERRTMSLPETARIIQQVSRGLARAHEQGIIHRDLKPENIFIVRSQEDDDEIAKVLDFGIAKLQSSAHNPAITSSTKTGAVLGTPFYMSPEQARGLRNVDHRTDIWSLGVIAYKCVTGKLPFDGESVGDLLVKICTAPIPMPSQLAPELPSSFDHWFMRALEREPDRRFSSVAQLAEALSNAAGIPSRSAQRSTPLSALPTMGAASSGSGGHSTPHGPSGIPPGPSPHLPTPGPGQTTPFDAPPGAFTAQAGGAGMGSQNLGARTPQPGAMTNAPFTSSQPVPGVPGGRGKLIAGILGGLVVILGTAAALLFLKVYRAEEANATNGTGLSASPPSSSVSAAPPASETHNEPLPSPAESVTAPAQSAAAVASPGPTSRRLSGSGKAGSKSTAPPLPGTPTTAAATAASAAPASSTTAKKPSKNDPGY
jgi:eukaryotic-like serine/threonine-protein kinase